MPICTKTHIRNIGNKKTQPVPCYYIAGVCIVNPNHEGGLTQFLKATRPYHHARFYEESKQAHETIVPNDIVAAHYNEEDIFNAKIMQLALANAG